MCKTNFSTTRVLLSVEKNRDESKERKEITASWSKTGTQGLIYNERGGGGGGENQQEDKKDKISRWCTLIERRLNTKEL